MAALAHLKDLRLPIERGPQADLLFNRRQNRVWRSRIPMSSNAPSAGRPVADQKVVEVRVASQNNLRLEVLVFVIEKHCGPH